MDTEATAGRSMPTYRALAQDIKNLGVDVVFGLMSDDTALFAVEIDTLGIAFYGGPHENIASFMLFEEGNSCRLRLHLRLALPPRRRLRLAHRLQIAHHLW